MPSDLSASRRRGPGRPAGGQPGEGQEALLQAARELMAEKGLPQLTVREVAERAGVQPALVSYYFGGKQGLLQALTREVAASMVEGLEQRVGQGGDFAERLRDAMRHVIGLLGKDPYGPRLVVEQVFFGDESTIDAFVDQFARRNFETLNRLLDDGRRSGDIREVEAMFLAPMLFGSSLFFFLAAPVIRRLYGIEEITPELAQRFGEHAADVVLRGILTRPEEET
ncbi:MAG: TetR/AcrR family transcriptional regulator [Myxococcota bacterium]